MAKLKVIIRLLKITALRAIVHLEIEHNRLSISLFQKIVQKLLLLLLGSLLCRFFRRFLRQSLLFSCLFRRFFRQALLLGLFSRCLFGQALLFGSLPGGLLICLLFGIFGLLEGHFGTFIFFSGISDFSLVVLRDLLAIFESLFLLAFGIIEEIFSIEGGQCSFFDIVK